MLFVTTCPAAKGAADLVLAYPARGPIAGVENIVRNVASLAEARAIFEAHKAATVATGAPAYVGARWQQAQALGGGRMPRGLKAAIAAGEFRAYVNLPE